MAKKIIFVSQKFLAQDIQSRQVHTPGVLLHTQGPEAPTLMTSFWRRLYEQPQTTILTHKVPSDILFSLLMTDLERMKYII